MSLWTNSEPWAGLMVIEKLMKTMRMMTKKKNLNAKRNCLKGVCKFALTMVTIFMVTPFAAAEESFQIELNYKISEGMLKIDMERLSRDEVKHFMQRLVIYKNEESQLQEELVKQNYLNQITKWIPFMAEPGDIIKVVIHYGKEGTYEQQLIVPEHDELSRAELSIKRTEGGSVLVRDLPLEKQKYQKNRE